MEPVTVRRAAVADMDAVCGLDEIAQHDPRRASFIGGAVEDATSYVAVLSGRVVGYAVLNYKFYGNGWIDMLSVQSGFRRRGAASALLRHVESVCEAPKLFTSTNLSNLPMQSLLAKHAYALSGVIHNLDEGDPELVYFKQLPPRTS